MRIGLRRSEVENILREKLKEDPDLKYYVDNDYITRLIDLLIEGIAETIGQQKEPQEQKFRENSNTCSCGLYGLPLKNLFIMWCTLSTSLWAKF